MARRSSQPTTRELAENWECRRARRNRSTICIVIGGGPAGLAAAVYGASEGLRTILDRAERAGWTSGNELDIENYLGFPAASRGADLARRAATQAKRFGAEIITPQEVGRDQAGGSVSQGDPRRRVGAERLRRPDRDGDGGTAARGAWRRTNC